MPNLGGGELLIIVLLMPVLLFTIIYLAVRLGSRGTSR
jgi:hypothetical protein